MKFDEGKRDWSLLPLDSVEEIIKVLEFGSNKYAAWNFEDGDGLKFSRLLNSSFRHLTSFTRGEDNDPETGLSHVAHLGANVLFLLHFLLRKDTFPKVDDRYQGKK